MRRRILFFLFVLLTASAVCAQQQAEEVLETLQKKYGKLRDASASFTETTYLSIAKVTQKLSGTIRMKTGNKYRIETPNQILITDGTTVWRVNSAKKQVIIDSFKEDPKNPTPDKLLFNAPKDFNAIRTADEKLNGASVIVLKLTPKSESSTIKSMKLWISEDDDVIRKVETIDFSDTQKTYEISKFTMDAGLSDALFTCSPTQGYETIDLR